MSLYDNLYLNNCRRYENQTFFLKTNDLRFTQQKFELKNQRNKRFIKLFTNVQYTIVSVGGDGAILFRKHKQVGGLGGALAPLACKNALISRQNFGKFE